MKVVRALPLAGICDRARIPGTATLCLSLVFVLFCATHTLAQPPTQAGLVVSLGDGAVETRCVDLREGKVTGYDLLVDSGLEIEAEFTGAGVTICSLAGQGCPAENCFCKCQGGECTYWSYWHITNGAWVYSPIGAAAYTVQPGTVEGWSWGEEPPPVYTLEQICAPQPTATPTNTLVPPTGTPESTATATQTPVPPTATPVPPTATATPAAETSKPGGSTPTPTATAVSTPTSEPTATAPPPTATTVPTQVQTHTPSPIPDAPERPAGTNYMIFGGIVVVLVVVGVVLKRR